MKKDITAGEGCRGGDESEAGAPRILTRAKPNVGPSGGGYGSFLRRRSIDFQ
jgi:hypothetical protein